MDPMRLLYGKKGVNPGKVPYHLQIWKCPPPLGADFSLEGQPVLFKIIQMHWINYPAQQVTGSANIQLTL